MQLSLFVIMISNNFTYNTNVRAFSTTSSENQIDMSKYFSLWTKLYNSLTYGEIKDFFGERYCYLL